MIDLYKTFEIFNRETVSAFAKRVMNIFMIQSSDTSQKGISIDNSSDGINLNIVNRPKVYNLFVTATKKYNDKYGYKKRRVH